MGKKKDRAIIKAIKSKVPYIVFRGGDPVGIALPWETWLELNQRIATIRHESTPQQVQAIQWTELKERVATPSSLPLAEQLESWYSALQIADDEKDDFTQWFQKHRPRPEDPQ